MKLVFTSGPLSGAKYRIDGTVQIGRGPSTGIVIDDPAVSLVHCQVDFDGQRAFIKDLGSTNGITVNAERLINAELHHDDMLLIGVSAVRVELITAETPVPVTTLNDIPSPGAADQPLGSATTRNADTMSIAAEAPRKELAGNIFGAVSYFLKRKIADGGMGSVYEAEQFGAEGFVKKVAIKTILPEYAKNEKFVSSFVGEAKLVANLVHQNIVQIHHLGRHDNGYYIAMEYIDGINLTNWLSRHRELQRYAPVDIATYVTSRICRGLEYAHSKTDDQGRALGLVHRDVSPNNVMITREGEIKLTDFGVAKAARFMEDDGRYLVGSVEYMSPEQAHCDTVDGRSDIFSLGLIYYELLTRRRVFVCRNDDIDEVLLRVKEADIPDPRTHRPDIPEPVVTNLMKCLHKNPSDRYQSAGALAYQLEREMYSRGYGPTIVTLAKYVNELFIEPDPLASAAPEL